QTAYLKAHYPVYYMAALLSSVMDRVEKIAEYIENCKQMGIKILPPNINESEGDFSVTDDGTSIRFGLKVIKTVGEGNVDAIVLNRNINGKYRSLTEFIERLGNNLNSRCIEALILSGCFDCLGGKRTQYFAVYEKIYKGLGQIRKNNVIGQMDLFAMSSKSSEDNFKDLLPDVEEFKNMVKLSKEKELTGIYLSGHPLDGCEKTLNKFISCKVKDFPKNEDEVDMPDKISDGELVRIGGVITSVSKKFTRNSKQMAFITLEDMTGSIEVIVFPKTYDLFKDYLEEEKIVVIDGRASVSDNKINIISDKFTPFESLEEANKTLWIKIPKNSGIGINNILNITNKYPGYSSVILYIEETKKKMRSSSKNNVTIEPELRAELEKLLGEGTTAVREKIE
ncbi:MAG: OB-fold nucleic acid binding domain-containing protein, partial [Lachnospirales bacterium]